MKRWKILFSTLSAAFLMFIFSDHAIAVPASPQWAKTYGGSGDDQTNDIKQTADGGYIVAGNTYSFGAGQADIWILKLDGTGIIQWQKTYGGAGGDYGSAVEQTTDGGYVIAGTTSSFGAGSSDMWVIRLDGSGNIQWQKTYGGSEYDSANSIHQTADGGYIIAGSTMSFGSGSYDVWIIKIDGNGNITWQKTYGDMNINDIDYSGQGSIQQTADGGYVLAAQSYIDVNCPEVWVIKLNSDGNLQWQKYGSISCYYGAYYTNAILQTPDKGYIVAGSVGSAIGGGGFDLWLMRLSYNGELQWEKEYDGGGEDQLSSIKKTGDCGYVLAGSSSVAIYGIPGWDKWDFSVVRLDSNGNVRWNKRYGGTGAEGISAIHQTTEGAFIAAGHTDSFGEGGNDIWAVKLLTDDSIAFYPSSGATMGVFDMQVSSVPVVVSTPSEIVVTTTNIFGVDTNASAHDSSARVSAQAGRPKGRLSQRK